jgi:hypothetical protein
MGKWDLFSAADCEQALDTLMTAVHRHTGGHGHDDMALLLLEHGTPSPSHAQETQPPPRLLPAR